MNVNAKYAKAIDAYFLKLNTVKAGNPFTEEV